MIDVGVAIDEESEPVILKVPGPGTYDDAGNYTPGAFPDPLPIIYAVLQPVTGRELRDLPEGLRKQVSLVGWTRTTVAVGNEIGYGGTDYRIVHVWGRPMNGFNKFAIGRKV